MHNASMRAIVVKTFRTRRQMERVANRMSARGYEMGQQSGDFTTNPFVPRWNRRKVVVTFQRVR